MLLPPRDSDHTEKLFADRLFGGVAVLRSFWRRKKERPLTTKSSRSFCRRKGERAGEPRAPQRIAATVLFGGGAAAYVESVRGGVVVVKIVGTVFVGLGALLMVVCAWWLRAIKKARIPRGAQR